MYYGVDMCDGRESESGGATLQVSDMFCRPCGPLLVPPTSLVEYYYYYYYSTGVGYD